MNAESAALRHIALLLLSFQNHIDTFHSLLKHREH